MKITVFVLLFALFAVFDLHAQSDAALNNTTIIKMVKAKLSDNLIIDEINSSEVNFDLSNEGIKTLTASNVSDEVIQAMKAAYKAQEPAPSSVKINPEVDTAPAAIVPAAIVLSQDEQPDVSAILQENDTVEEQAPAELQSTTEQAAVAASIAPATDMVAESKITVTSPIENDVSAEPFIDVNEADKSVLSLPAKKLTIEATARENGMVILIEQPALSYETISYVQPVSELIPFYNSEFSSLAVVIREWDIKLRASLEKERQSLLKISKIEKELTSRKNSDAKPFSKEIIDQNKNLVLMWEQHKTIKNEMVTEGKKLAEDLKKISKETESAIDTKFKEVSKNVKSADADPSAGKMSKKVIIPPQKFTSTVTGYFAPVTMMLVCYQNEIITVQNTIAVWNEKALNTIQKDSECKSQLNPLQEELTQYQATTKQNQKLKKKEISALKKQCDAIEKERKQLAKQMTDDGAKLSEELNKMKTETISVIQERFTDIIQIIEHSYQDKFNL